MKQFQHDTCEIYRAIRHKNSKRLKQFLCECSDLILIHTEVLGKLYDCTNKSCKLMPEEILFIYENMPNLTLWEEGISIFPDTIEEFSLRYLAAITNLSHASILEINLDDTLTRNQTNLLISFTKRTPFLSQLQLSSDDISGEEIISNRNLGHLKSNIHCNIFRHELPPAKKLDDPKIELKRTENSLQSFLTLN